MTTWYNPFVFSKTFLFLGICWGTCSALGCHRAPGNAIQRVTVCDLREKPDEFNGKVVQTAGWIYVDIERFGVGVSGCGVDLNWPEDANKTTDSQMRKLADLIREAKH